MTESEVKEKLSHLLSQEYLDYSAILSLSSELIKFDESADEDVMLQRDLQERLYRQR